MRCASAKLVLKARNSTRFASRDLSRAGCRLLTRIDSKAFLLAHEPTTNDSPFSSEQRAGEGRAPAMEHRELDDKRIEPNSGSATRSTTYRQRRCRRRSL